MTNLDIFLNTDNEWREKRLQHAIFSMGVCKNCGYSISDPENRLICYKWGLEVSDVDTCEAWICPGEEKDIL